MAPTATLTQLRAGIDAHDLDALVACFAPDYCNETPRAPPGAFADATRCARTGQRSSPRSPTRGPRSSAAVATAAPCGPNGTSPGTRTDGHAFHLRGVTVLVVPDDLIARARFYLEPVDTSGKGVDQAVRDAVGAR